MTEASAPVTRGGLDTARALLGELARSGVRDACVSPGSRSTPLVLALAETPSIRPWVITDERSAAFFAVGCARQARRPVLLVCTSGTAAANYLPAIAEASRSRVPLIVATADRPPELRDCGANQTIDQVGLFSTHVRWSVDLPIAAGADLDAYYRYSACRAYATAMDSPRGPVHLNVPFREPLLDETATQRRSAPPSQPDAGSDGPRAHLRVFPAQALPSPEAVREAAALVGGSRRGLIVCGPQACASPQAADTLARLAARLQWPMLADALSGLRFGMHSRDHLVDGYDLLLREEGFLRAHRPDLVLQFGGLPVSKRLEAMLAEAAPTRVVAAEPGVWSDPSHAGGIIVRSSTVALCTALLASLPAPQAEPAWTAEWLAAGARLRQAIEAQLEGEGELFEAKVFAELATLLPDASVLHVGNSMPVRDLDTFGVSSAKELRVEGNRGASGIDGVLSSALGAAASAAGKVALVVGDLSFLHDVGALQIPARHDLDLLVVVVNNDGGGVFSFLPQAELGNVFDRYFATPHGLDLAAVSGPRVRHTRIGTWGEFRDAVRAALARKGVDVIEVPSSRQRNLALHRRHVADALRCLRGERWG